MDNLKYFLLYAGYPRSGHTLVAAILNANPNVYCSNQLNLLANLKNYKSKDDLFSYIKSWSLRPETWKDTTQIPHVPKEEIKVIGDKTGHRNVEIINGNPHIIGKFKSIVKVPVKWIHVVRNPFDNLATWATLNFKNKKVKTTERAELDLVIQKYRKLNETIAKLRRSEDVLTVNHEFIITRMHGTLEEMANFLEISFDPTWRDNVRNTVWKRPRITRGKVSWSQIQKKVVKDIIDQYEWLKGYEFGGCGRC